MELGGAGGADDVEVAMGLMVVFGRESCTNGEVSTLKMGLTIWETDICKTAQSRVELRRRLMQVSYQVYDEHGVLERSKPSECIYCC